MHSPQSGVAGFFFVRRAVFFAFYVLFSLCFFNVHDFDSKNKQYKDCNDVKWKSHMNNRTYILDMISET